MKVNRNIVVVSTSMCSLYW